MEGTSTSTGTSILESRLAGVLGSELQEKPLLLLVSGPQVK